MPLPFALDHINLWLLEDGDRLDDRRLRLRRPTRRASCGSGIFAGHLRRAPVRRIVVTHCHPDHVGQCRLAAPPLRRAARGCRRASTSSPTRWRDEAAGLLGRRAVDYFARHGLAGRAPGGACATRGNRYRRGGARVARALTGACMDGDALAIGGRRWRVIMGYGHAPEHAALYCAELGVLISGDMLLPRISHQRQREPGRARWRSAAALPGESRRPLSRCAADTLVLPSHGLPFRGMRERVAQLAGAPRRAARRAAIDACGEPKSRGRSGAGTLFRRELDGHQTLVRHGRGDRPPQLPDARRPCCGASRGADGIVRFVRDARPTRCTESEHDDAPRNTEQAARPGRGREDPRARSPSTRRTCSPTSSSATRTARASRSPTSSASRKRLHGHVGEAAGQPDGARPRRR